MALQERADRGVYGITTAAELAGMAVPTLRLYERRGLLAPGRTDGGTRRYNDADLVLLGRIGALVADGVNLTGVAHILALNATNAALSTENANLEIENTRLRAERENVMTTRADDVPEHDHLDQLTPANPDLGVTSADDGGGPQPDRWDADPTDAHEQATPVELDDDAYPHQTQADDADLPG